jgi:hypothetical protein
MKTKEYMTIRETMDNVKRPSQTEEMDNDTKGILIKE